MIMKNLRKAIYKVCLFLRQKRLLPWCIWSPVYDHCHRDAIEWERNNA